MRLQYIYKTKNSKTHNSIKVGIDYELGGYNYFTSGKKPRCYYVYATPCNINGAWAQTTLFDDSELGRACQNIVIKEVERRNVKYQNKLFEAIDWEKYGEAIENKDFDYLEAQIEKMRNV